MKNSSVRFEELPSEVQRAIVIINAHRREFRRNAKSLTAVFTGFSAPFMGLGLWMTYTDKPLGKALVVVFPIMTAIAGYSAVRQHDLEFREEYNQLHRAFERNLEHPAVKRLLHTPRANFIGVKNNGSIVAMRVAPSLLGQPIGRRATTSPIRRKKGSVVSWVKRRGGRRRAK